MMPKLSHWPSVRRNHHRLRGARLRVERLESRLALASDAIVALSLEAADLDGNVLTKLTVGQPFDLRLIAEDLREEPQGVFAAYMDVFFPSDKVEASGNFVVEYPFINGVSGTVGDGILDEVGAFSNSLVPIGGGRALLGTYRFMATEAGTVEFVTDPADRTVFHDILVYGRNVEVGTGQVTYNVLQINSQQLLGTTLRLVAEGEAAPELVAQDDHFKLLSDSDASLMDVLSNDTIPTGAQARLVSVSAASGNGSAQLSADEKSILFKPAAGMIGSETLTYVVRDQSGNESTAQIVIDVASRFQNQEIAQDRDNNGTVLPLDALLGINALNARGPKKLEAADLVVGGQSIFLDVNGDGYHTAIDELLCINMLNQARANAEGESAAADTSIGDATYSSAVMPPAGSPGGTYLFSDSAEDIFTGTSTGRRRR